jgi:hypothetical protein
MEAGSWPSDKQTSQRRDAVDGGRKSEDFSVSPSMGNFFSEVKEPGKTEDGVVIGGVGIED